MHYKGQSMKVNLIILATLVKHIQITNSLEQENDIKTKVENNTYSKSAAEKSGLLKAIPVVYFVNEAEAVLNPTSAPR